MNYWRAYEATADLPTYKDDAVTDSGLDNNKHRNNADKRSEESKSRFRKKRLDIIDPSKEDSIIQPERMLKTDHNSQRKIFSVEIVELLIISIGAILLPLLVFLYFYFGK